MFANLRIARPAAQALVVPASAVLHEGSDDAVMVKTGENKYDRRLVTTKPMNDNEVVISSGLKPGDVVVTEGAALLRGTGE